MLVQGVAQTAARSGPTSIPVHTTAIFKLVAPVSSHSRGTWRERTEKSDDFNEASVIAREILATIRMWLHRSR